MKSYLIQISERLIAILAFIFPFTEISYYFGAKVFLGTDSMALKIFYLNYKIYVQDFFLHIF